MGIVITMAIESDDGHVAREKEVLRMDRGADSAIAKAGLGLTLLECQGDTHRSATGSRCRAGKTNCDAIPGLPGLWRAAQGEGFSTRCVLRTRPSMRQPAHAKPVLGARKSRPRI